MVLIKTLLLILFLSFITIVKPHHELPDYVRVKTSFDLSTFDVIGPFPSAPREDVDVLEAFGGIDNIERGGDLTYPSDLVFGGRAGWTTIDADSNGFINIGYNGSQVNWTLIEDWAGSSGSYFSGWALSDFNVDEDDSTVVISCSGVGKFYVDNVLMQGDSYFSGIQFNSIVLNQGVHTVSVRFIGSEGVSFVCTVQVIDLTLSPPFMITSDIISPYVIDQVGFSSPYVSIVALNLLNQSLSASAMDISTKSDEYIVKLLPNVLTNGDTTSIEPGQILPLNFIVEPSASGSSMLCVEPVIQVPIQITYSSGQPVQYTLNFTCVEFGQPYSFTFLDFDGSVQYSMARPPNNTCEQFENGCPVLITFHGADVEAKTHAWTSAYVQQNYSWILFPTNRRNYGFDWQNSGFFDAFTALHYFVSELPGVPSSMTPVYAANEFQLQYAGHSMGGHGCAIISSHRPDRALSISIAAGWISMELYTPFFLRLGYSWSDPWVRFILEAATAEYNADLYSPHWINIPMIFRMGADDTNVPPFHLKRMNRLYAELRHNATGGIVSEIPGEPHWWGGVVDDATMQAFFNQYVLQGIPSLPNRFVVTTLNPASFESKGGISIQQLITPFRISKIEVIQSANQTWDLTTENVKRFGFVSTFPYFPKTVNIDGQSLPYIQLPEHYCYSPVTSSESNRKRKAKKSVSSSGPWSICNDDSWTLLERSPLNYGPHVQIIQNPIIIVYGSGGSDQTTNQLRNLGVYLANNLYYQERYSISVVADYSISLEDLSYYNFILIGGPAFNKVAQSLSPIFPVDYNSDGSFSIGSTNFNQPETGLIFLSPCYDSETQNSTSLRAGCMVSVIDGIDLTGLQNALTLFPTKSSFPMPDYAVTGPSYGYAGAAGLLSLGFWDNNWQYQPYLSYTTSILN